MEECRPFEIELISASGLKDVRLLLKTKVYAQLSISSQSPDRAWYTPVDKSGRTEPTWKCKKKFFIPEKDLQEEGDDVVIVFYAERSMKKDKYVGEVALPLKELFNGRAAENKKCYVRRKEEQGTFGTLKFSYRFGDSTESVDTKSTYIQKAPVRRLPWLKAILKSVEEFVETLFEVSAVEGLDLSNEEE